MLPLTSSKLPLTAVANLGLLIYWRTLAIIFHRMVRLCYYIYGSGKLNFLCYKHHPSCKILSIPINWCNLLYLCSLAVLSTPFLVPWENKPSLTVCNRAMGRCHAASGSLANFFVSGCIKSSWRSCIHRNPTVTWPSSCRDGCGLWWCLGRLQVLLCWIYLVYQFLEQ